jgi:CRP-like cAMP-binding protein
MIKQITGKMDEFKTYLRGATKVCCLPKNTQIYYGGDVPEYAYLIAKGLVKVYDYNDAGVEYVYSVLPPNTLILGDAALFKTPQQYSYKAITDVVVYEISCDHVHRYVGKSQEKMLHFMRLANQTNAQMLAHSRGYVMLSSRQRLSKLLLQYASCRGDEPEDSMALVDRISGNEITPMIGVSPTTVVHELYKMADDGLISREGKQFYLYDVEKLSELATTDEWL